ARATRAAAIVPPAPATFSMTTGCPSLSDIFWPIRRATPSVALPAPNGTTMVTGLVGYVVWACKGVAAQVAARKAQAVVSTRRRGKRVMVDLSGWWEGGNQALLEGAG